MMNITKRDALIVIDLQNDFCPGGALAVNEGDAVVPGIIELAKKFDTVVLTQDWHPSGHASFASSHNAPAFSTTQLAYGEQTLWPDHCVQGTVGAAFHELVLSSGMEQRACAVIRKGMNPNVDSYSAFYENDKSTATGLAGYLKDRQIERVFVVGLAYDFCVAYSAIDAIKDGFDAVVLKDLCRAIGMPLAKGRTTVDAAEEQFDRVGVSVLHTIDLEANSSQNIRM